MLSKKKKKEKNNVSIVKKKNQSEVKLLINTNNIYSKSQRI